MLKYDEINKDFDRYKFRNLKNIKSNYFRGACNLDEIAISEIFNLRRFITNSIILLLKRFYLFTVTHTTLTSLIKYHSCIRIECTCWLTDVL